MTTAEITAWQLGVTLEEEVRTRSPMAQVPDRLGWDNLTTDQARARFTLGDERFSFWVLQGAHDALTEHQP